MTWWAILLSCWGCFVVGFFTAALMAAARGPVENEDGHKAAND